MGRDLWGFIHKCMDLKYKDRERIPFKIQRTKKTITIELTTYHWYICIHYWRLHEIIVTGKNVNNNI